MLADPTLPPLTDDPLLATEHLVESGCCRLTDLMSPRHTHELRKLVLARAEADRAAQDDYSYSGGSNQRVWMLVNDDPQFLALAENADARESLSGLLGPDALLSNLSANITGPGGGPMVPHWDQDWAPRPWPYPLVAHIIWMLDEFTEPNGATLVAPGSHLTDRRPTTGDLVPATGPAGTALIIDGRLWHGTGSNTSGGRRIGLLAYYCRPFVRQQENFALSLSERVRDRLSVRQRELLGLEFYEYLNMVGGPPRSQPRY